VDCRQPVKQATLMMWTLQSALARASAAAASSMRDQLDSRQQLLTEWFLLNHHGTVCDNYFFQSNYHITTASVLAAIFR